jgi:hypothetical protein
VRVAVRETGRPWGEREVAIGAAGQGALTLGAAGADVVVVATDGRAHSDTLRVRVTDRAYLGDVVLRAEYPAYSGRAAEALVAGETVRVPRGTTLIVQGRASVALNEVRLAGPAGSVALAATGHVFAGRFAPRRAGGGRGARAGPPGAVPELPVPLDVQVLADSAPQVALAAPASDTTIDGLAPLRASACSRATTTGSRRSRSARGWSAPMGGASAPCRRRWPGPCPRGRATRPWPCRRSRSER